MMSNVSLKMLIEHLEIFPSCKYIEAHDVRLVDEDSEQYKCQSYYDEDGHIQDCSCGECR